MWKKVLIGTFMEETIMRSLVIILVLLLGGCETTDAVKGKGATFADRGLTEAEWLVCNAASIGSVKRRYGQTVERANTYKAFCDGDGLANVIVPE